MSDAERTLFTRSAFRIPLPGASSLVGTVLAIFFILHILAGMILQSAKPISAASTREEAMASRYD